MRFFETFEELLSAISDVNQFDVSWLVIIKSHDFYYEINNVRAQMLGIELSRYICKNCLNDAYDLIWDREYRNLKCNEMLIKKLLE